MARPHALVVGASIAGPMTAYWLSRAGYRITIIERFPTLRPGGQCIDIRTSGVTIMRRIPGMEAAVKARLAPQDGIHFVTSSGRPFATMRPTGDPNQQNLISEYEIFRDDLSRILYDLTSDDENIEYVFGEQVAAIRQDEKDRVEVEFKEGKLKTAKYDLVVAADGATSRTRALGLGCDVKTHMHPMGMWCAYASLEEDFLKGSKTAKMYSTTGGRALALGPDHNNHTRAMLMSVYPRNETPFSSGSSTSPDTTSAISAHFTPAGWLSSELTPAILSAPDYYSTTWAQVRLPPRSLSNGHFTLVGDAGYAPGPTGGGTTLALTGAYVLAGELLRARRSGRSVAEGLAAYEERMAPIVADLQKVPPGVPGVMAPQTWWGVLLRNAVLVVVTWGSGLFGGLLSYFAASFGGDKYGVPEYEFGNGEGEK